MGALQESMPLILANTSWVETSAKAAAVLSPIGGVVLFLSQRDRNPKSNKITKSEIRKFRRSLNPRGHRRGQR